MRIEGSPTWKFHQQFYRGRSYASFADDFNQAVVAWQPTAWAQLFRRLHAGYVVLTSKHHDGFSLWPSTTPHPFRQGFTAQRDLVGELAAAVRSAGMRWGVYYSGGFDWTFTKGSMHSLLTACKTPESRAYSEYAYGQLTELIAATKPSVIWNDIGMPINFPRLKLWSHYYNAVPDGVINDR